MQRGPDQLHVHLPDLLVSSVSRSVSLVGASFVLLMPILAARPATSWAQGNVLSVRATGAVAGAADVVIPIDMTVDQDLTGAFSFDVSFDPSLCNQLSNPSGIIVRKGGRQTLDPAENPIVCSSGKITIAVLDLTGGTVIPQGSGEIFEIDLGGLTAAATGTFTLSPPAMITGHHNTATVTVTGQPGTLTITPFACGDINGDHSVDIGDSLIIAQYDVGLRVCGQAPFSHPEVCNVNNDSSCNVGDALRIAQCSVGLIGCTFTCPTFSCPP